MNRRQLIALGFPPHTTDHAVRGIASAAKDFRLRGAALKEQLRAILAGPETYVEDPYFADLAQSLLKESESAPLAEPITYRTWGTDIDEGAHRQMREACRLPVAAKAALMPDAHLGYGLPIGGVLGLRGAVAPYAVGVDIACRMKLSVIDMRPESLEQQFGRYKSALEQGTRFGVGSIYERPRQHDVMDEDWNITRVTRESKNKAWKQLGTSGSGNHFVEFGTLTITEDQTLGHQSLAAGTYVALLSHSGSRGPGAAVCSTYSGIARQRFRSQDVQWNHLAWLSLDSHEGQEYWEAMNLMGRYAAANHAVIHQEVARHLGAETLLAIENHHNFAWKESHGDEELIVHRKGATPAGPGVLGIIPGSMGTPGFVVRGKGNAESLHSASHGAGRCMSRTQAKNTFRIQSTRKDLLAKGVHILSAGSDEVPGVYKDIHAVMAQQRDLVDVIGRFDPKIVKMCDDGSRAED